MQLKQAAIWTQRSLKPAVRQVQAYYLTCFHVACNAIPGTTILFFFPKLHLRLRVWLNIIVIVRIWRPGTLIIIVTEVGFFKWKLLLELQQSSAIYGQVGIWMERKREKHLENMKHRYHNKRWRLWGQIWYGDFGNWCSSSSESGRQRDSET